VNFTVPVYPIAVLLPLSCAVTVTEKGVAAVVLVGALTTNLVAAPAALVSEKFAALATPLVEAVTLYEPVVPLAVKVEAVAMPELSVVAEVTFVLFANFPLAPLTGAVKVTVAPETGLLFESFNIACRAVVKGVPIAALCGVPAVAAIEAAIPAFTVIPVCEPAVTPVAEALMDCEPAVFSVAPLVNVWVPLSAATKVYDAGEKVACGSVLLNVTVPV
jgi:hypothetical protein